MTDFKGDLNTLETRQRRDADLPILEPVGPRPATRGRGEFVPPVAATGGIASPLTEKTKVVSGTTVPDADFWPSGYPSSDGLFVLPAIKTRRFLDADGADVQIDYANPVGVPV